MFPILLYVPDEHLPSLSGKSTMSYALRNIAKSRGCGTVTHSSQRASAKELGNQRMVWQEPLLFFLKAADMSAGQKLGLARPVMTSSDEEQACNVSAWTKTDVIGAGDVGGGGGGDGGGGGVGQASESGTGPSGGEEQACNASAWPETDVEGGPQVTWGGAASPAAGKPPVLRVRLRKVLLRI